MERMKNNTHPEDNIRRDTKEFIISSLSSVNPRTPLPPIPEVADDIQMFTLTPSSQAVVPEMSRIMTTPPHSPQSVAINHMASMVQNDDIMDEDDGDENDGLYTVPGSEISDESSVTTMGGDTKGNE